MKKTLSIFVEDEDLHELMRIVMDNDADGALVFLKQHYKGKAHALLEGVGKIKRNVPDKGITDASENLSEK
jgi:hypothetical protein